MKTSKSPFLIDQWPKNVKSEIQILRFIYYIQQFVISGCGTDWAVSPLSRLLTVLYLLVGLPIMYLYLTSTGSLMARLVCFLIRGLMCKSMTNNRSATNQNTNSRNSSKQCTPQHEHSAAMISRAGILYNDKRSTWQTRSSLAARSSSNLQSTANINTGKQIFFRVLYSMYRLIIMRSS